MFKFLVNKNGTLKWIPTEAICVEDAVENIFKEKCVLYDVFPSGLILTNLDHTQLYSVKEVIK